MAELKSVDSLRSNNFNTFSDINKQEITEDYPNDKETDNLIYDNLKNF